MGCNGCMVRMVGSGCMPSSGCRAFMARRGYMACNGCIACSRCMAWCGCMALVVVWFVWLVVAVNSLYRLYGW